MQFGLTYHAIHFLLGEATGGGNRDLLFAPTCLIARRHMQNAVGVDVEGHLNLWDASWGRRDAFQAEATQALVVPRQFALALQHMNLHRRLVIFRCAEGLGLAHRDRRVARD